MFQNHRRWHRYIKRKVVAHPIPINPRKILTKGSPDFPRASMGIKAIETKSVNIQRVSFTVEFERNTREIYASVKSTEMQSLIHLVFNFISLNFEVERTNRDDLVEVLRLCLR